MVYSLPRVNLNRHESEGRVTLDEEHDLAAAVIFISACIDEADELPSAEMDDALRHILCHMYECDLSIIWAITVVRKNGVVDYPALLQRLLWICKLNARCRIRVLMV